MRKGRSRPENPKTPQDVLATIYRHLDIDTQAQYADFPGGHIRCCRQAK